MNKLRKTQQKLRDRAESIAGSLGVGGSAPHCAKLKLLLQSQKAALAALVGFVQVYTYKHNSKLY